jgi:hypothetical protein
MLIDMNIERFSGAVSGALFVISALLAAFLHSSAAAQPRGSIKIGYSIALTGDEER